MLNQYRLGYLTAMVRQAAIPSINEGAVLENLESRNSSKESQVFFGLVIISFHSLQKRLTCCGTKVCRKTRIVNIVHGF